jgi:cell division protein FtsZ
MKNGGVAILGKAEVEGDNRAQMAIEEALSSPLLNDNDIRGAKWILININSAEGEHECTMDELETINNYLRLQAGENTDVIVGMGYDNTLDKKIGITLIATGFEHRDPFAKPAEVKKEAPRPEKIVMTLGMDTEEAKPAPQPVQQTLPLEEKDPFAPRMEESFPVAEPVLNLFSQPEILSEPVAETAAEPENHVLQFELSTEITGEVKMPEPVQEEAIITQPVAEDAMLQFEVSETPRQPIVAQTGLLNKPVNIYAESQQSAPAATIPVTPAPVAAEPVKAVEPAPVEPMIEMQLVEKEEAPRVAQPTTQAAIIDDTVLDDAEEQKRRAAERIQKLRNLSFNMNGVDSNNEFDSVPAYVRRNMELFGNTLTSVEDFYSKYTVGKDENNQTQISTINTFLDGKKPD